VGFQIDPTHQPKAIIDRRNRKIVHHCNRNAQLAHHLKAVICLANSLSRKKTRVANLKHALFRFNRRLLPYFAGNNASGAGWHD
jgi:hypothetical protein